MDRRSLLKLAVIGALSIGCSRSNDPPLKSLSVDEVDARIAKNDGVTFVYDNNDKDRFNKGHVPGAHWVQFDNVTAGDLPADKKSTLIFYCANSL